MTKQQYIDKYNESFEVAGLHCAMIFHYDPILEVVECRSIYSKSRLEMVQWLETGVNFYTKNKIDFICYIDGVYERGYGDLNKYIKEEE